MTATQKGKCKAKSFMKAPGTAISFLLLAFILVYPFYFSEEASKLVLYGLKLSLDRVIPTSFPFMIMTEFYTAYGHPENLKLLSYLFESIFGINKSGQRSFICGNVAGFPLGARITASSYSEGLIDKNEAERLLALSSNPSLPFILGAVGGGMYKSFKIGILLAVSLYLSTILSGIIFRRKLDKSNRANTYRPPSFSLVKSISKAGESCIGICSFITFFSVVGGLCAGKIGSPIIKAVLYSILEVTSGVYQASSLFYLFPDLSLAISAFSLGFGGLSVMMQSAYLVITTDLRMKKYLLMKLTQGILSAGIMTCLYNL